MSRTIEIKENNGEFYIELPDDLLAEAGWKVDNQSEMNVEWIDNQDGSWSIKRVEKDPKVETEMVLVECISQYRMRYVVEMPKGNSDWALDTVVCNEATEFSQLHLGETIVSHRVIDRAEFLKLYDEDNDYCRGWSDDVKIKNGLTTYKTE